MSRVVDVAVRVVDMPEFRAFVGAAGNVVQAYEAVRCDGADTPLGAAVDAMRDAMRDLVTNSET